MPRLTATSDTRFTSANGLTLDFTADGLEVTDSFGTVDAYARVPAAELAPSLPRNMPAPTTATRRRRR